MATIDVALFLQPTAEDPPCGQNLEYDPAFGELERAAEGKPEQVEGDKVISKAEDPQWRDMFEKAEALLRRSRDLRVAVYLTHAGLNLGGVSQLAAGLRLIAEMSKTFWDEVHPQLDEEDKDPTLRINSIQELESLPPLGTSQRPSLLRSLERVLLVRSKQAGSFSYRDIKLAKVELSPTSAEKGSVPQLALIEAAFQECELDDLQTTAKAVVDSVGTVGELRAYLRDKLGSERAPEFRVLDKELNGMRRILEEPLARRGVVQSASGPSSAEGEQGGLPAAGAGVGEIRTREDVVRILDKVSDYFQKYEPSSPVPLLLQRAKRLVAKDFMEILRDLTPAGVSQAEAIGGVEKHK
jgi:type VI secretion system protein ImpA